MAAGIDQARRAALDAAHRSGGGRRWRRSGCGCAARRRAARAGCGCGLRLAARARRRRGRQARDAAASAAHAARRFVAAARRLRSRRGGAGMRGPSGRRWTSLAARRRGLARRWPPGAGAGRGRGAGLDLVAVVFGRVVEPQRFLDRGQRGVVRILGSWVSCHCSSASRRTQNPSRLAGHDVYSTPRRRDDTRETEMRGRHRPNVPLPRPVSPRKEPARQPVWVASAPMPLGHPSGTFVAEKPKNRRRSGAQDRKRVQERCRGAFEARRQEAAGNPQARSADVPRFRQRLARPRYAAARGAIDNAVENLLAAGARRVRPARPAGRLTLF